MTYVGIIVGVAVVGFILWMLPRAAKSLTDYND